MEQDIRKAFLAQVNIPEDTGKIFADYAKQFEELMMIYQCAIQEVTTKLEILSHEMSVRQRRNPIESIKYRIKKPQSIAEKLVRIVLFELVHNLKREKKSRVVHGNKNTGYVEVAIKVCFDSVDCNGKLRKTFKCIELTLHRNDYAVAGNHCIDREHAE